MTPDRILLGVVGCLMLKYLADREIARHRCFYCGVIRGHDPDCPWQRVDDVIK